MRTKSFMSGGGGGLKLCDVRFEFLQIHQKGWSWKIMLEELHRGESISDSIEGGGILVG